ncbi:hypothetical protein EYR38_002060 [Pleurotus pulmonarius]|nr:hypothetical protein EYR38_002060 [Pleurotus pulmonarius]
MMLFQKPPTINLSSHLAATHHRRHPSAPPTVVVQPTRTPGLLSLSKPSRPSPQRPQQHQTNLRPQQRSTPKFKPVPASTTTTVANQRSPQLNHASPQLQKPVAEKVAPTTPERSQAQSLRGRPVKASKDKAGRSASQSPVHGRRNHTRQPSPPVQPPQAEVNPLASSGDNTITNANPFDPFSDDFQPKTVRPTPSLASRPSGQLAKRRQPIPSFSLESTPILPTKTKAVDVPHSNHASRPVFVSRSDPVPSHMPTKRPTYRPGPRRSATLNNGFPICDDMGDVSDADDTDDSELSSTPVTPVRPRQMKSSQFDDGPRTAPLSSSTGAFFPFNMSPSPTPVIRAPASQSRKHRRAPSEGMGVFQMSSDEESTPSDELKQTLFGLLAPRSGSVGLRLAAAAAAKRDGLELSEMVEGYFASSLFQNSPSPEELPPPAF